MNQTETHRQPRAHVDVLEMLTWIWPGPLDRMDHARVCVVTHSIALVLTALKSLRFEGREEMVEDLALIRELALLRYRREMRKD